MHTYIQATTHSHLHTYMHTYIHPDTHRHRDREADTVAGKHMGLITYIHRGNGAEIHTSTHIYKLIILHTRRHTCIRTNPHTSILTHIQPYIHR